LTHQVLQLINTAKKFSQSSWKEMSNHHHAPGWLEFNGEVK